mmetsp:Transcript_25040/g.38849  ORF Transcript_25040/g.38849 Transcript_25040/m.38849 type:complete len:261 (+) Transcript_25040:2-784(+)
MESTNIKPDDDPFLGVALTGYTMDESAIELGVYFVLSSICMFFLLDEVRGKPKKLKTWLLFRKLEIFQDDERNSEKVKNFLLMGAYFYMVMPFLTLVAWTLLILWDRYREDESFTPAVCILVLGLSFLTFAYNVMKVKWSNYRFKFVNVICIILSILLVSVYEGLIIFTEDHEEKFFPYSAFFLKFNMLCLAFLVFFSKYTGNEDMLKLLTTYFPKRGTDLDRMRDDDIQGEIEAQSKDPAWEPSYEDLTDIITISKVSV